ncbi:MAG: hypothetical protein ACK4OE_15345 [Acidovorax sp.]|uniref:hypothetical protein n=1 Tax=Acidovorax sp. TaxID=1872122 RepID=UPI003919AD80
MNRRAHPTTDQHRTTPCVGCTNTHPAYHHLHRVHHSPAATRACTADQCQQGRTACPCPQACELPTDEAPATAAELVSYLGVVLAAVAVVALLVVLAAGA